MNMSDDKDMLMRKLTTYEFGCRNNLYLMFELLSLFSNSLCSNENNLIYFLKQLGNKGKRKFSASRAVFSCNVLRGNTVKIFLS